VEAARSEASGGGGSSWLGFLPGVDPRPFITGQARLPGRAVACVLRYFCTGSGPGRADSTVHGECGVRVHVTNVTC
jgi:hypothetical protein